MNLEGQKTLNVELQSSELVLQAFDLFDDVTII
jgi:hypothetical protein